MPRLLSNEPALTSLRVEFWRDPDAWPKDSSQFAFLGRIVHDVGRLLYGDSWTGHEPATIPVAPIRPKLDGKTPEHDIRTAIHLLSHFNSSYEERAVAAHASGEGPPLPDTAEWAYAYAISKRMSEGSFELLRRFHEVGCLLETLFENGWVQTAIRPNRGGAARPVVPGDWFNEATGAWFATCQIDRNDPFSGIPIIGYGDWIYVELGSYYRWRETVVASNAADIELPDYPELVPEEAQPANVEKPARVPTDRAAGRKAGRKPEYDWPAFFAELTVRLAAGAPKSQSKLVAEMQVWCVEHWGKEPATSTIHKRICQYLSQSNLAQL
jgi:hypothetical protein